MATPEKLPGVGDQLYATRNDGKGRPEGKLFTVEKVEKGVARCISHRLKIGSEVYIRSHHKANFRVLRSGVLTDTAQIRRDGTTRWVIKERRGNVNDPAPAYVPAGPSTP